MKDKQYRRPEDIRRAIEQGTPFLTPDPLLAQRVMRRAKGEEPQMKRKLSAGAVLVIALLIVMMTAAVAEIIIRYNQNWYFDNRFTNLKKVEPDTYQEIMDNLAVPAEQHQTRNSLVDVTVQDVAWVADKNLMTFTVRVAPKDPEKYELYPMMALDTDGFDDDREEHWLFISSPDFSEGVKSGPPYEMMNDPGKTLLLLDCDGTVDMDFQMVFGAYDSFRAEDGTVILYYQMDLNQAQTEEGGELKPFAPTGDTVQVCVRYRAVEYTEGMENYVLYHGGEPGQLSFAVNLK